MTIAIYNGDQLTDVIEVNAHDAQKVAAFYTAAGYTAKII